MELRALQYSSQLESQATIARQRLEGFFNHSLNPNSSPESSSTTAAAAAANTANLPQFRSQHIQNEIQELSTLNRVSHVLSTSRSEIERTLENLISRRQRAAAPPASANQAIARTTGVEISNQTPEQAAAATVPTVPMVAENHHQPWLLARSSPSGNNPIEQMTREQIVGEISELVHRQVVSNALHSDFRTSLEQRVLHRLRAINTDGERTRDLIRGLRTNDQIQRNDFSHLGIGAGAANNVDIEDSASSYTEHRVQRSVLHNTREIRELKNEITELKSMLKLSFEVQLDMQRSLKQEISALIAGTFHNQAASQLVNSTRPANEGKCVICTEVDIDAVLYQCGHMCACYVCSLNLKQKNLNCPVCRAPIKDIVRTYRVGLDD
jgi:hypothetical protein